MQAINGTGTVQVTTKMTSMTSAIEPHYLARYHDSRVSARFKLSPGQLHNEEQLLLLYIALALSDKRAAQNWASLDGLVTH